MFLNVHTVVGFLYAGPVWWKFSSLLSVHAVYATVGQQRLHAADSWLILSAKVKSFMLQRVGWFMSSLTIHEEMFGFSFQSNASSCEMPVLFYNFLTQRLVHIYFQCLWQPQRMQLKMWSCGLSRIRRVACWVWVRSRKLFPCHHLAVKRRPNITTTTPKCLC